MQLHELQRRRPNKSSKRVGRGGKRGKTAGRGTKGQNSRAGAKKRPEEREMIKKLPKLRGRGKNFNTSIQEKPVAVNLTVLEDAFASGDTVSPQTLKDKRVTRRVNVPVKILGTGSLTKSLSFEGVTFSKTAADAVKAAGGSIKE